MLGDWTLFAASCHCPAVADHRAHPRLLRTIRKFVAYRGAAGKDAEQHLSAIRYAHLCHGLPDPTSAEVNSRARLAAEGITRSRELSRGVKKAAPATTQMLAAMQTIYRKGKSDSAASVGALAALAAAVAAFAGCLRLGAVIPESPAKFLTHRHWRMRGLTFDKEQLTISLRSSKTEVVTAARLTFEATGSGLCPVRLLAHGFRAEPQPRSGRPALPAPRRQDRRQARRAARVVHRRREPTPPGGRGRAAHGPLFTRRHGARASERGLRLLFCAAPGRWKSESAFREYLRQEFREYLATRRLDVASIVNDRDAEMHDALINE
jgi:hypothetical protein